MIGSVFRPRVNGLANGKLQEGIYSGRRERPPGFYTFLLLGAAPDASAADVGELLARLWGLYRGLKEGVVPDLPTRRVPDGDLQVLLGLGSRAFELPGRPVDAPQRPKAMRQSFEQPAGGGGGPVSASAGISYEADVTANPADVAIAFQFTAKTPLAVERAVVETGKLLSGEPSPALSIQAVYAGTKRDDGRSWIDFHDGPSNLSNEERPDAILIPLPNPPAPVPPEQDRWTSGGTYLAFMRLYIDLAVWAALEVPKQEALVGRQKESGLPLKAVGPAQTFGSLDPDGEPPHESDPGQYQVDTPLPAEVRSSHIQRANHHDTFPGGSANPQNHRIYRQGYPFFEPSPGPPGFRVGLNFASFQSTPANLTGMLGMEDWLGNTNFGGAAGADRIVLLSARAAGFFLVPPVEEGERFPGERALTGA